MLRKSLLLLATLFIAAFAALVLTKTLHYYSFEKSIRFLTTKSDETNDNLWFRAGFYIHITTSLVVLVLGLLQWLPPVARACTAGWATATWWAFPLSQALCRRASPTAGWWRRWALRCNALGRLAPTKPEFVGLPLNAERPPTSYIPACWWPFGVINEVSERGC